MLKLPLYYNNVFPTKKILYTVQIAIFLHNFVCLKSFHL